MAQKPAPYKIMNRDMAKSAYKARSQNFVLGITSWLLTALILTLGFGQLLRFEIYGLPIYLHDLIVITILALYYKVPNLAIPAGIRFILLGLSLALLRASTLYPLDNLVIPLLYALRLLAYLSLYLVVKNAHLSIPTWAFWGAGSIALAIGLTQYLLLPDMRVFQYLGWDDHLNRLTLPHFDPAFTAVMLCLALLAITNKLTISYVLFMLCSTLAILLTYSRSTWLSLALTASYFMIKNKKTHSLIIGVCILIIPILFLPKKFGEGTNLLRTYSVASRLQRDLTTAHALGWDLLVGVGYHDLGLESSTLTPPNHSPGANSSLLLILTTSGVVGIYGWFLLLRDLAGHLWLRPVISFVVIASLFNNVLLYPFVLLWILLLPAKAPSAT